MATIGANRFHGRAFAAYNPAINQEPVMPMYEYECRACGKTTEALRKMDQADQAIACEHCGSRKTARVQSVVAVGAGGRESSQSMGPGSGCGRCGDPRGSCGLN